MISFAFIVGSLALATFIPTFVSLYLVSALRPRPRYLAAFGVGLTFWYFYDTLAEAASLGVNNALYPVYLFGGIPHLVLIGAFVAGVAFIAAVDHVSVPAAGPAPGRRALFLIPAVVALVMGVHGLGEGWGAVSAVSSSPTAGSDFQGLVQAFGTFPALASYPVHKFLEASMVAIIYTVYLKGEGTDAGWWEVPLLGLLFAGPSAIGAAFGYYYSLDTTYFFAFGVTAALYAMVRMMEPIARSPRDASVAPAHYGFKVFFAIGLGMLVLYAAALLH
ncbi:MAG: hypothetical protein KGI26_02490 [Thaumarchaeota archaeon]|nr:hypothetical protein [Nitrososphaerota archaeon]